MTVVLIFIIIFQTMTLAGVLTLMEEKDRKAGEKHKKHVYRKMSEPEARQILRDLANEMSTTAEETAAIDAALERQWCYLDGPCQYGNPEIQLPEENHKEILKEMNESEEIQELCEEGETPSERKTGKWIKRHYAGVRSTDTVICLECGEEFSYDAETGVSAEDYNFCPNCGEKKKEQRNE